MVGKVTLYFVPLIWVLFLRLQVRRNTEYSNLERAKIALTRKPDVHLNWELYDDDNNGVHNSPPTTQTPPPWTNSLTHGSTASKSH